MKLIDVHAHLNDEKYEDVEKVIKNAKENGVETIICSSSDLEYSKKAVELAKKFDCIYATVGVHPEEVDKFDIVALKNLAKEKKVVAIGEIGLDYHYFDGLSEDEIKAKKNLQKEVFEKQLALANELSLPVVIHSRDAMGDTIEILQKNPPKKMSLLHCYGGSFESAEILIKMNFMFSFGGIVTFKSAKSVQEVVEKLPLDRILTETDCPYLSPEPFRKAVNEPKNIVYIIDKIAKLKGLPVEVVAEQIRQNAKRLFGV